MKIILTETGEVVDYEDSYAMRLIEQGKAIAESAKPITPQPEPIDPAQYGSLIEELQGQTASLQTALNGLKLLDQDNAVFADMYQSVAQAQERKLEYNEEHLQQEIDAMVGEEV